LRGLRDGFVTVLASLFSSYPLFIHNDGDSVPSPSSAAFSTVVSSFDVEAFLSHAKPAYSAFLHTITQSSTFQHFIRLRCSHYMKLHRQQSKQQLQMRQTVSLTEMLRMEQTAERNSENQNNTRTANGSTSASGNTTSLSSLSGISSSSSSTAPPRLSCCSSNPPFPFLYLFDDYCFYKLSCKWEKWLIRQHQDHSGYLLIARGSGPFKKRFVVLQHQKLFLYKSKKISEEKKEKFKYCRVLERGAALVKQTGNINSTNEATTTTEKNKFSFQLIPVSSPPAVANHKSLSSQSRDPNRLEIWHFRADSDEGCRIWVKLLQSRLISEEMRLQWEQLL